MSKTFKGRPGDIDSVKNILKVAKILPLESVICTKFSGDLFFKDQLVNMNWADIFGLSSRPNGGTEQCLAPKYTSGICSQSIA